MKLCNLFPDIMMNEPEASVGVTGISADSRRIRPGMVFVAIKGHDHDGHDYIQAAIDNGACAIIGEAALDGLSVPYLCSPQLRYDYAFACARFWPKRPAIQIAITGTNGKTSVAEFVRQIWQRATWPAASIGTLGAKTAQSGQSLDTPHLATSGLTTPGAEDLFRVIDELARQSVRCIALEASSHGIAQDRLAPLPIHVAGFTNLSRDHLDYHGTMDQYFKAKLRLFTHLLPDGGAAVINHDDPYGKKITKAIKDRPLVIKTIGASDGADLQIKDLKPRDYGFDSHIIYDGKSYQYPIALMGRFQAENAILAALLAHLSGLSLHDALGALPHLQPIAGRMQPVHGHPLNARILVDYAHTPDALANALRLLREETTGDLHVLFGCGGDRDAGKREMMGAQALAFADHIYITDDNPRSEDPAAIRAAIMADKPEKFTEIANRKAAIQVAIDSLKEGDCLLIAGKGHETTQTVGHETLPFDDAAVARAALAFLPAKGGA
ncbi:MAG: UDP-N-acetylmuramoyl-L-alanyl-D-glutamate--2,6-diaminopimelate ligase [Candidatus Puniceispirillaceae bacterium]